MRPINAPPEFLAAARPHFDAEDIAAILPEIDGVLRSGRLILGAYTDRFEREFASHVGTRHAVAVSSCTSALQIVLRFLGARGREVIVPANNFPGGVSAVLDEGGTPVLAEIEPRSFCIDAEDVSRRLTPRTAGIVAVHIAGLVCPGIDRLREMCRRRGLFLIEDAAHAHGAGIGERKAGQLADAACFSFYPTKIVTTGTGGMVTTDDSELADFARSVRHHGQGARRGEFLRMGNDWCMGEIQAILGFHQLSRLDAQVETRNRIAQWYRDELAGVPWVDIPGYGPEFRHAYYKLPMLLAEDIDTRLLRRILEEEYGVENGSVYDPPCYFQPALRDALALGAGAFPVAERALARQFCPPIHARTTRDQVGMVVEAMQAAHGRVRVGH